MLVFGLKNGSMADGDAGYMLETLTVGAVKVSDAEDIGSAALGGAVEAGAGSVRDLTLAICGSGDGDGEEGEDGGDGELHFDGWVGLGFGSCVLGLVGEVVGGLVG